MKYILTMLFFTMMVCVSSYAQKQEVVVLDYFETQQEGTLNRAVEQAISSGTLSNTVFKLKPYGVYVLDGSIITPAGQTLEIIADPPGPTQNDAPPMICWTASTAPSKTYMFDVGNELKMKNVWILWASLDGTRYTSTIRIGDSATVSGGRCEFENVIFDYVNQNSSGAIQPYATHFKGYFRNCYFRNATDDHFRYYSRAVSVPYLATGLHTDTLMFENCTFANIGYVYMQERAVYGDNVYFNHCTFYNVVMYTLESGWWYKMFVTNSLFINTFMYGYIPTAPDGINGGTVQINPIDSSAALGNGFGFTVPFTEQDRRILFANNNYYLDQWLVDWMGYGPNGSPYSKGKFQQRLMDEIPRPQPALNSVTKTIFDSVDNLGNKAWPFINRVNLDSLNPGFVSPPINLDSLKDFLNRKWSDNSDINWAWNASQYLNNGGQRWPLAEDMSYTNATLKTAGMGGFPLGDLYRWWPAEYAQWEAQKDAEHNRIFGWLQNGKDPLLGVKEVYGKIPSEYSLSQNHPNPFNPTTEIEYSIPISGNVSLKVYNNLGQHVTTIFDGYQNAGNYVATFDGSSLASGVYFYKLQTENILLTKKLVLMK
ncbi:MAG: T9SS type A sorting domain-containing protein [Ignavibacteriaceae bacterium]|nr:T9SS type A sorting domain-containing protein [Ignavibacteriaceae bacterium]